MLIVDNHILPSGKYIYVEVLTRYFVMRLTVHLCTRRGLSPKLAHWCMTIENSACVDPIR